MVPRLLAYCCPQFLLNDACDSSVCCQKSADKGHNFIVTVPRTQPTSNNSSCQVFRFENVGCEKALTNCPGQVRRILCISICETGSGFLKCGKSFCRSPRLSKKF